MPSRPRSWGATALAVALLLGACGGASTPPLATSPSPDAPAGGAVTSSPKPDAGASAAVPSLQLSPPADDAFAAALIRPGTLVICSSFPRPRFAERDAAGKAIGLDIEIGEGLAAELGLAPDIREVTFADLIDAVAGGTCDISVAGQFITQGRLRQIDMIPYREGTQHVVVRADGSVTVEELSDLCGRRFGVVAGSIHVDIARGTGDYAGRGIDDGCRAAGAANVDVSEYETQADAEAALIAGEVDAYSGNDFVTVDRPESFALAAALPKTRNGIGHRRDRPALDAALRSALRAMIADGTYRAILDRYGLGGNALTIEP